MIGIVGLMKQAQPTGYMADGGRYRRRRHATLSVAAATTQAKPEAHQPKTQPLDMTPRDDERCLHGVTPVVPTDASSPAYRDMLVVTFRAA